MIVNEVVKRKIERLKLEELIFERKLENYKLI